MQVTWHEANVSCTGNGGHLPFAIVTGTTIHRIDAGNLYSTLHLTPGEEVWIGNYITVGTPTSITGNQP